MEARITFDLSDPDDRDNHEIYVKALDFYAALIELDQAFRRIYKYKEPHAKNFEEVREKFYEILEDRNISNFLV